MGNKALVLLSGGLDSAVAAAIAKQVDGYNKLYALTVDYLQAAAATELACAKRVAAQVGVWAHFIIRVCNQDNLYAFRGALTDSQSKLVTARTVAEAAADVSPPSLLPGRNMILLSLAMAKAAELGIKIVYFGGNANDYNGYLDCRSSFLACVESAASKGLGYDVYVRAPLLKVTKADVYRMAQELGVDVTRTSSCYLGRACGTCDACIIRADAMKD